MCRAAFEGVVDFKKAHPFDRQWWLRLNWALDWLERRSWQEVLQLRHRHQLAAAQLCTPEDAARAWDNAREAHQALFRLYVPWHHDDAEAVSSDAALFKRWADVFGNPDAPATRAKIQQTAADLLRGGRR